MCFIKILMNICSILFPETIKVYDGYSSLRKRLFRTVTVHKMCSKEDLLMTAMRAFVVSQDSRNFYLLDVYANTEQSAGTFPLSTPPWATIICNGFSPDA